VSVLEIFHVRARLEVFLQRVAAFFERDGRLINGRLARSGGQGLGHACGRVWCGVVCCVGLVFVRIWRLEEGLAVAKGNRMGRGNGQFVQCVGSWRVCM
jgi:hypothetical protein